MINGADLRFFQVAIRWLVRRYGDSAADGEPIEEIRRHLEAAEAAYRRIVEGAAVRRAASGESGT